MTDGIVSLLVHIKGAETKSGGLKALFGKKELVDGPTMKAQITYRIDDDNLETEDIF